MNKESKNGLIKALKIIITLILIVLFLYFLLYKFYVRYPNHVINIILAARYTIIISIASAFFGLLLGTIIALNKSSKIKLLRTIANFYTDLFRGTPVILQLSIIYFVVFGAFDVNLLIVAITSFSLNSAAYISEIMRAGIQNVDKGQIEAAKAMGVRERDIATDIVIPQAIRKTLPPLINELATLIKESSVVYIIGVSDLMYVTDRVTAGTFLYFEPLLIAGICYYVLVKITTILGKYVEVKLSYDKNK
ncbi:MAG: artQ 1 [Haloplasmataceae bacterium]|jgi:polar amino acid transport system permease protein|nr:artQ 1 [Haloplasmataceae bacterium]